MHLDDCPHCRNAYCHLQNVVAQAQGEKQRMPNPYFFARVQSKLQGLQQQEFIAKPSFIRVLKPVVLSFIIIISMTLGVMVGAQFHDGNGSTAGQNNDILEMAGHYQMTPDQFETIENYYISQ